MTAPSDRQVATKAGLVVGDDAQSDVNHTLAERVQEAGFRYRYNRNAPKSVDVLETLIVDGDQVSVRPPNFWDKHPRITLLVSAFGLTAIVGTAVVEPVVVGKLIYKEAQDLQDEARRQYYDTRFTDENNPGFADVPPGMPIVAAIGDSNMAQPANHPTYRNTVDSDGINGCWTAKNSTVSLLAGALDAAPINLACSGLRIAEIEEQQIKNIPDASSVVLVSAGANDINLLGAMAQCAPVHQVVDENAQKHLVVHVRPNCLDETTQRIYDRLPQLKNNMLELFSQVKAKAHDAEIIVVLYPIPLPKESSLFCSGLDQHSLDVARQVAQEVNSTLEAAATIAGVNSFNPNNMPEFNNNQFCTSESLFADVTIGNLVTTNLQGVGHVNDDGAAVIAQGVYNDFFSRNAPQDQQLIWPPLTTPTPTPAPYLIAGGEPTFETPTPVPTAQATPTIPEQTQAPAYEFGIEFGPDFGP